MAGERYKIRVALKADARATNVGPTSYSTNLKSPVAVSAGWYTKAEFEAANGVVPTLGTAWATKDEAIEFFITKEEFQNDDKFLWVWCEPHGDGSVLPGAGAQSAQFAGRLHIAKKGLDVQDYGSPDQADGAISGRVGAKVHVTESPLYYTAFAMTTLARGPTIKKVRESESEGNKQSLVQAEGVPMDTSSQLGGGLKGAWGSTLAGTAETGAYAQALGQVPWANVGEWDLKPPIFKIWGNYIRLGNEFNITQDRHLSNISYGYLCAAAGLTWQQAMTFGSGTAFPYVRDNETPVRIGHALFQEHGAAMTKDVLKAAIYAAQNTHILLKHDDFNDVRSFNKYSGDGGKNPPGANDKWTSPNP